MGSNSLIQFIAAFGVVFLCILNAIVFLLGIGTIVVGVQLDKEIDKQDDIMNLLDKVDLGDYTLKEIVEILVRIVIAVGVFTVITTLIGGFGALCKLRPLLLVYIIIVIFCIILEITILAYWIKLINGVDTWLNTQFNDLLKKYEGPSAEDLYSLGWNLIFIFFTCCGVQPTTVVVNDFRDLPSTWWSSRGSDVIPVSCCESADKDNFYNHTDTACTENLVNYHKANISTSLAVVFPTVIKKIQGVEIFSELSAAAISITSFIILVEIIAIFFSAVIIYVTTKRRIEIV